MTILSGRAHTQEIPARPSPAKAGAGLLLVPSFRAILSAAGDKEPTSEWRVRFANRCNGQSHYVRIRPI
jgi:hypothetical protein